MSARLPSGGRVSRVERMSLVRVVSSDEPANEPLTAEDRRLAELFSGSLENGQRAEIDIDALRREGAL